MSTPKGTILVTGANGGLGSAIAEHVASDPELSALFGLYTVRDATKSSALTSALSRGSSGHSHEVQSLDLTNLDNIRQFAEHINARVSTGQIPLIRALILNAGYMDFGKQAWTEGGTDITFAANYLGHWLLTLLLLKSMDRAAGRIVIVGSQASDPDDKRNASSGAFAEEKHKTFIHDEASFEAIAKGTWSSAKEDASFRGGYRRYGAAKLFLIMMIHELQRRIDQDTASRGIRVVGLDPGQMSTGLQRHASWAIRVLMFKVLLPIMITCMPNGAPRTTQRSASDVLDAAFGSPSDGLPMSAYLYDRKPLETSSEARDAQKRELVWRETVRYAHLKEGDTILANWQ